jgi:EamA domain-containing membrane protein RarD
VVYLLPFLPMASDLLAGCFALGKRAERIERRYVIAFAAGVLLSVTFFDVLPEAEVAVNAAFLALGFVTFYVLEKAMMIHACGESECETHQMCPTAEAFFRPRRTGVPRQFSSRRRENGLSLATTGVHHRR